MRTHIHNQFCKCERDKTIDESQKLRFQLFSIVLYEPGEFTSKWEFTMNGMRFYYIFVNIQRTLSLTKL